MGDEKDRLILLKPFTHQQMQSILDKTNIDHSILEAMYCQSSLAPDLGSELLVEAKIESPE